jgi:hypothetical protein
MTKIFDRSHRKRTQEYMTALESEIQRLRNTVASLNQVSSDWKRCAVVLVGPPKNAPPQNRWTGRIGPGVFIWKVPDVLSVDGVDFADFSSEQLSRLLLPSEAIAHFSYATIPPPIETYDATTRELLLNCELPLLTLTKHVTDRCMP